MTSFAKRMGGSNASRVSKISGASGHASDCSSKRKGYAIGGSVLDGPEDEMMMEGDGVLGRLDKPARKSPATVVNVTVAGKGADAATPPLGLSPPARAPAPPPAPMGPPPGPVGAGGPPMPGQLPPLPLGPMKDGGRAGYAKGGKVASAKPLSDRYDGGSMPVPPKKDLDSQGKPIYAKGGKVAADCADAVHKHEAGKHKGEPKTKFALGGKVEMHAGTGSGEGRLEQAHREKRKG